MPALPTRPAGAETPTSSDAWDPTSTPAAPSRPAEAAVEVTGLVVRYGERTAVDGLSLTARAGEVLAVLGPNGAGKTSTVESLEGYRRPDAGQVRVLGLDPATDHRALTPRIGVMLQRGGVYPMLGPRRVLQLFAAYYDAPDDVEHLLDLVALTGVAGTPWRHLSGGEQQRLALALALVGRPEVVFLDEPTAGVDPEGRLGVRDVIAGLRDRGVCVLLTTHELGEAERLADRVVILNRGRAVATGTPSELAAGIGATSGGEGSTVTFGAPAGLDVATLGAALGAAVAEGPPGRYRVTAAASPALTAQLAAWLAEHDTALTDLRTVRTLEEAYLAVVRDAALEADRAGKDGTGRGASGGPSGTSGGRTSGRKARRRRGDRGIDRMEPDPEARR
jgi:ABC-2 type transport system ATP-binding protein